MGIIVQYFNKLLEEDLEHILKNSEELWDNFNNKTIFITGGTGFIGKWFLETFAYANLHLDLNCKLLILSRNPEFFLTEYSYFGNNSLFKFIKGDVRNFDYPEEPVDYIIHAATESSEKLNSENPLLMFDTIVDGTRNVLNLAKGKKVKSFLFTSSGAVYGQQPDEMTHILEEYIGSPDCLNPKSAYGEGKRAAEMLCSIFNKQFQIPVKIARCFAFVGPYLPLDAHFAIGNFINDILIGGPIIIHGSGLPYRSYLYSSDLIIWLLKILLNDNQKLEIYNVGSDRAISIKELAFLMSKLSDDKIDVVIQNENLSVARNRYIPATNKINNVLGIEIQIPLEIAILKTIAYYRKFYS